MTTPVDIAGYSGITRGCVHGREVGTNKLVPGRAGRTFLPFTNTSMRALHLPDQVWLPQVGHPRTAKLVSKAYRSEGGSTSRLRPSYTQSGLRNKESTS